MGHYDTSRDDYIKPEPKDDDAREYLLVTDRDSKILKSGTYIQLKPLANLIRRGGGEVTIFKATKG